MAAAMVSHELRTPLNAIIGMSDLLREQGLGPTDRRCLGTIEAAGDNLPYAMDGTDNTVDVHAFTRGLDYLELEVRQDLLVQPEWRARFLPQLLEALALAGYV